MSIQFFPNPFDHSPLSGSLPPTAGEQGGKREQGGEDVCRVCRGRDTFGAGYCINCRVAADLTLTEIAQRRARRWRRIGEQRRWLAVGLLGLATAALTAAARMAGVI